MVRMTAEPTAEQLAALQAYAEAHGRRWKSDLADDWMAGTERTPALREVRNQFGPTWLMKFKLPKQ